MSEQTPLQDPLADAFNGFRGETLPLLTSPGADAVRGTVRRRQRNRQVAAACAIAMLAGTGFALAVVRQPQDKVQPADPPSPTTSATGSPSPSASDASPTPTAAPTKLDLRSIDWRNTAVPFPAKVCGGGVVAFQAGRAAGPVELLGAATAVAYGDVDADGLEDALLPVRCAGRDRLVAVGTSPSTLRAIGSLSLASGERLGYSSVQSGTVRVAVSAGDATEERTYRWTGSRFDQVGGQKSAPPPLQRDDADAYDWSTATLQVPFKGSGTTVQPNDRSCPRLTVTFTNAGQDQGAVQAGGCEYWVQKIGAADLNGDGTKEVLVRISATFIDPTVTSTGTAWFFAYTLRDGKPHLLGFVTADQLHSRDGNGVTEDFTSSASVRSGAVTVRQTFRKPTARTVTRTFTWNGSRFVPSQPPPDPRADQRP